MKAYLNIVDRGIVTDVLPRDISRGGVCVGRDSEECAASSIRDDKAANRDCEMVSSGSVLNLRDTDIVAGPSGTTPLLRPADC